ncbi:MAG TPA: RyR domain-containing protein [Methanoregulaceae archaeon]|nr:RyR domain-containing protein [Methanoregulaceae archaeon]
MANGIIDILNVIGNLLRFGIIPVYSQIKTDQISYLTILAAGFAGSSSAGLLVIYFRDKIRQIPLVFCRDHVIICGVHETAEVLVQQFRREKTKTVVIGALQQGSIEAENVRRYSTVMLDGDPKDTALLSLARVKRAKALLALTESDGMNAEIALSTMNLLEKRKGNPLPCILQISNPGLWKIIREKALSPNDWKTLRLDFYNGPALGARVLLKTYFTPFMDTLSTTPSLFIVVGAGRLGESIIVRASREWFERNPGSVNLEILLVDLNAVAIRDRLLATYPHLSDRVTIHPFAIGVHSAEFQSARFLKERAAVSYVLAFVCLNDDTAGLTAALTLSHLLIGIPSKILVRMDHNPGLARLVESNETGAVRIIPFNSLSIAARSDLVLGGVIEVLARAIHDQYLAMMQSSQKPAASTPAAVVWDDLPERLKDANRRQAEHILDKLRSVGCDVVPMTDWLANGFLFTPGEIEYLAEMEHIRWMDTMREQGFSFGSIRNEEEKTHPSMIPFHDLPEHEKEKDREAVRMIPHYLALIDLQIYRPDGMIRGEGDYIRGGH